jgi:hypothetical protein
VTTAKIILNSKLESGVGENRGVALSFSANYAGGKNAEWAIWTPTLNLTMNVKGEVADKFVIGQEYTLTFTEDKVVVE